MQFSDTVNEQGIVQAVRDYARTNGDDDSYPIEDITRNVNKYYRKAVSLIQEVDASWVWDDKNHTDQPKETTNLVDGQSDYTLDSNVRDILRVEVLDETGTVWRKLQKLDQSQIKSSIEEVFDTDSLPRFYEHLGESMILYPAPNYSVSSGLKIWEKRTALEFLPTDTTKEPGFDSQYHDYLAIGAAYEYAIADRDDQNLATRLKNDLMELEKAMRRYYSTRGGAKRVSFRNNPRI